MDKVSAFLLLLVFTKKYNLKIKTQSYKSLVKQFNKIDTYFSQVVKFIAKRIGVGCKKY